MYKISLNGNKYTRVDIDLEGYYRNNIECWTFSLKFPEIEIIGEDSVFEKFGDYTSPDEAIEAARSRFGCLFFEKPIGDNPPYSNEFYVYLKQVKDPFEEYCYY